MPHGHIALLGDSILDNAAYTGREPAVVDHLRTLLPQHWRATLYAVDGSTTGGIARQAARVPPDVSHIVLAVGGNDALQQSDLLQHPVRSTAEALALFASRLAAFERAYRGAIAATLALARPTTVCTIYNGNLEEPRATLARVALTTFNDVILRVAFEQALGVIELRAVCASPQDYANPIEPSGVGGFRIAAAIVRAVGLGGDAPASRVFIYPPPVPGDGLCGIMPISMFRGLGLTLVLISVGISLPTRTG
jgi:lysophospholipase L1-like esterase